LVEALSKELTSESSNPAQNSSIVIASTNSILGLGVMEEFGPIATCGGSGGGGNVGLVISPTTSVIVWGTMTSLLEFAIVAGALVSTEAPVCCNINESVPKYFHYFNIPIIKALYVHK
jgi:hypothetical protein